MSRRAAKINHLERLGLEPHPLNTHKDDTPIKDVEIVGRRSRKEWACSAGDQCSMGCDIDLDEVYVQHSVGVAIFAKSFRYHVACAIDKQVVRYTGGRRAAIKAQRARRAANVG